MQTTVPFARSERGPFSVLGLLLIVLAAAGRLAGCGADEKGPRLDLPPPCRARCPRAPCSASAIPPPRPRSRPPA